MNKILTFKIAKGEDGFYIASCDDFAIYTQGKTFEELLSNIKEATEVSLDEIVGTEKHVFPPIMMNMDFSEMSYA